MSAKKKKEAGQTELPIEGAQPAAPAEAKKKSAEAEGNGAQHVVAEAVEALAHKGISEAGLSLIHVSLAAQDVIVESLGKKVEEMLGSLVFINYVPEVLPKSAHEAIEDIVEYLQVIMMGLTHLPRAAREVAYFTCCNAVAQGVLQHVLSSKVTALNVLSLAALDLDCRRLAQYAISTGVPSLSQCFAEVHELVQAAIHPDLPKLADDPALRRRLFPRLDNGKLSMVLEKTMPLASTTHAASLPRLDKSTLRNIAKKVRAQKG